jgi:hypothetical protein
MLFDFFNYLHNNDLNDYINNYSSFLLSRKESKNNILNIRKNILIDTYLKLNNINNNFYYNVYYLNNFNDDYMNKSLINRNFKPIIDDEDDIDDHYKLMFIRNPEKKIIDYDEIDKKYMEEELKKEEEKYYDNLTDYDEDDYYEEDENIYDDNNNYYEEEEFDDYY